MSEHEATATRQTHGLRLWRPGCTCGWTSNEQADSERRALRIAREEHATGTSTD
ncbi:hypothetical protein [Kineosporia sp. NBRC 101731]|uniref:hypothetical protein n=1 Tax=Kineosporia sp. NBRC 101731 TaxID=3032199 RepID=UPI0024A1544A|nr:hypothetical protein [Kineosporia sp. NBRC 101731]GLY32052.1 hypothetical protein Kisp02_54170 [Kineosporia sp. NBRC 101731]